jgi:hypothetical protein
MRRSAAKAIDLTNNVVPNACIYNPACQNSPQRLKSWVEIGGAEMLLATPMA